MKKWVSIVIDVILVLVIGVLSYSAISMMVTRNNSKYHVPSAFGSSFLYVVTDSMENPDNKDSIPQGSGIIIQSVSPKSLKASNPIYDENHEIIDYDLKGDIVTFYYETIKALDTHRIIDIKYNEETGKYTFTTMGDNPEAHLRNKRETWDESCLVGKVTYHSKAFGDFLAIVSMDAAANKSAVTGKTVSAWFFPVVTLGTIFLLAAISIIDAVRKYRKEEKEREAKIYQAMVEAGIDLNDSHAVELFHMKEEIRLEYQETYQKEFERLKKELMNNNEQK